MFKYLLFCGAAVIVVVTVADRWVEAATKGKLYDDVRDIPHNRVGLLLGTAKNLQNGQMNRYYQFRIDAAVALFNAGKIDFILVSGDNGSLGYDETSAMQADLVRMGIPKEKIFMDYAGFRTLDSILRCKDVFGTSRVTVISQPFHNRRAVFIADHKDIEAIAFNARDVERSSGFKTQVREKFARVKMLLDLTFNKKAKFYGEKIAIK